MNNDMEHMRQLEVVAAHDVAHLRDKEATYKGSWKRRGGVGAFMMLARKWDRLEGLLEGGQYNYDVFSGIEADGEGADGSPLAEIRDLRRYLILVEAEMLARGAARYGKRVQPIAQVFGDRVAEAAAKAIANAATNLPAQAAHSAAAVPATDSNKHAEREGDGDAVEVNKPSVAYTVRPTDLDGVLVKRSDTTAPWREIVKGDDPDNPANPRWHIVDRQLVEDDTQLQHLHKLRTGLNSTEFADLMPWFCHMYKFDSGRNEWALHTRYARWAATGH